MWVKGYGMVIPIGLGSSGCWSKGKMAYVIRGGVLKIGKIW